MDRVRYLDVGDAVEIAARLTGLDPYAAYRSCREDLLVAALHRPAVASDGVDLHDDVPAKAAAMVDQIIRRRIFPARTRSIAVAIGLEFLRRNGWSWIDGRSRRVDELKGLLAVIETERGGMNDLARWFRAQLCLVSSPAPMRSRHGDKPVIYIGHPVSRLSGERLLEVEDHVATIRQALLTSAEVLELEWVPEIYPLTSHDSSDGSEAIYDRDRHTLVGQTAALVCLEHEPSGGTALNLWWATVARLPVLYLYPRDSGPGDLTGGIPARALKEDYGSSADIEIAVYRFLKLYHSAIGDWPRQALNCDLQFAPLWCAVRHRWDSLHPAEQCEAAAIAGLDQRRVLELLRRPRLLVSVSDGELLSLCAALGMDVTRWLPRSTQHLQVTPPVIPPAQSRLMRTAARSLGWPEAKVQEFEANFTRDLATSARRLPTSVAGWKATLRRYGSGEEK